MLTLGRKKGESIFIGEDIEVILLDDRKGRIRIGIKAPKSIQVDRSESLSDEEVAERRFRIWRRLESQKEQ